MRLDKEAGTAVVDQITSFGDDQEFLVAGDRATIRLKEVTADIAIADLLVVFAEDDSQIADMIIDGVPWVVGYDWNKVEDIDETPLFNDRIPMPVDMEEYLSCFAHAEVYNYDEDGNWTELTPATDLINYAGRYDSDTISLYTKDKEESSSRDESIVIPYADSKDTDDNDQTHSIAECLQNGMWTNGTYTDAFSIPVNGQSGAYNMDDRYAMNTMVKTYGRPSLVAVYPDLEALGPKEFRTYGNMYTLYWDAGSDYFGIRLLDTVNEMNICRILGTSYLPEGGEEFVLNDMYTLEFDSFLESYCS